MHNLQVRIKRPPASTADLELIEAPKPSLINGSFLARALWLALDRFAALPTPQLSIFRDPETWCPRVASAK